MREKLPGNRILKEMPGAVPHLSLGYSVPSPVFVTKKLQGIGQSAESLDQQQPQKVEPIDTSKTDGIYAVDKRKLWRNTVYPASPKDHWLVSGSATYWQILNDLPEKPDQVIEHLDNQLAELNNRFLYYTQAAGDLVPTQAQERYDRYIDYQVPRIKGAFLFHQLRLLLGNRLFFRVMDKVYAKYKNRKITSPEFIRMAEKITKLDLSGFVRQWIDRKGLPDPRVKSSIHQIQQSKKWKVEIRLDQDSQPYHLLGVVEIVTNRRRYRFPFEARGRSSSFSWVVGEKPLEVIFNRGSDFPVKHKRYYVPGNFIDDFHDTLIVYGTARRIEANHTIALRFRETMADAYSEILVPVRKDSEITKKDLASRDLVVLSCSTDNSLLLELAGSCPDLDIKKNQFVFQGRVYARTDAGLLFMVPNPSMMTKVWT